MKGQNNVSIFERVVKFIMHLIIILFCLTIVNKNRIVSVEKAKYLFKGEIIQTIRCDSKPGITVECVLPKKALTIISYFPDEHCACKEFESFDILDNSVVVKNGCSGKFVTSSLPWNEASNIK